MAIRLDLSLLSRRIFGEASSPTTSIAVQRCTPLVELKTARCVADRELRGFYLFNFVVRFPHGIRKNRRWSRRAEGRQKQPWSTAQFRGGQGFMGNPAASELHASTWEAARTPHDSASSPLAGSRRLAHRLL